MPANVTSMVSAENIVPWHGLGVVVEEPMVAEEAIKLAGLDWEVEKTELYVDSGIVTDWVATRRKDNNHVLGVVGPKFQIVQNREAFGFLDNLVTAERFLQYHTAGALNQGKRVWMLAKVHDLFFEPVKDDRVEPYLLLCNGHDGTLGLTVAWTSVRVVCQNTLSLALGTSKTKLTVRHTGNMSEKMQQARQVMGLTREIVETNEVLFKYLANKQVGDKVLEQFLKDLVPNPPDGKSPARAEAQRAKIAELAETGMGQDIPGVKGTAWGLLQAVTDFTTHVKTVRGKGPEAERRFESSMFGSGDTLNTKALELLKAL